MTTILELIEKTGRGNLPQTATAKRTTNSKYLFYLAVRHYRTTLGANPRFYQHTARESQGTKGTIEEISVFQDRNLFILEGFQKSFVEQLRPPDGSYILAETEEGEFDCPQYTHRNRRDILKVLTTQLKLPYHLSALIKMDWSSARDYPDIETTLRKAKAADWTEDQLSAELKALDTGNLIALLKRGKIRELLLLKERYGAIWTWKYFTRTIPLMMVYRAMKTMGQSDSQIGEHLGLGWSRLKELEEANQSLTQQDLETLAQEVIKRDDGMRRNKDLATDLFLAQNPISLRRTNG